MPTTPKLALRYPLATDPADVPTDLLELATDVETKLAPGTVTSLPGTPYDGQVIDYLADATNGIVWRLKYRAASASAYKWEFVGGSPMRAKQADGVETTTNTTVWGAGAGAALPSVTLPLAGDYDVAWSTLGQNDTIPWWWMIHPYQATKLAPADDGCIRAEQQVAAKWVPGMRSSRFPALGVGALTCQVRIAGAGTAKFLNTNLIVTPTRVG